MRCTAARLPVADQPPGEARSIVVLGERTDSLDTAFAAAGLAVDYVAGATRNAATAAAARSALTVLDLATDTAPGWAILAGLRDGGATVPVVAIGAARDEALAVEAFEAGADAVLASPFDPAELVARCRALLRRGTKPADREARAGQLSLDAVGRTASVGGRRLDLSTTQFAVLEQLARRPGQVTTRQLLLDRLYGGIGTPAPGTIDFFIHALRRQLAASDSTTVIETVRGVGFRLREKAASD